MAEMEKLLKTMITKSSLSNNSSQSSFPFSLSNRLNHPHHICYLLGTLHLFHLQFLCLLPCKSTPFVDMTNMAFRLVVQHFPSSFLISQTILERRVMEKRCPVQIDIIKRQVLSEYQGNESDWAIILEKLNTKLRTYRLKLMKNKIFKLF